ncbi:MAG: PEP-CTERM sorting domain-containing protein [Planctomycetota bacterium]|nr:PEP-CTERM sorting domain-containing protein [Planctomycetota bacterium]
MVKNVIVVALVLGLASIASAGFLATDGSAMPAFQGTQAFASGTMSADVDYAVYAPGNFGNILTPDPSGGTDYVYAYQVMPTGTLPVTFLTVGLATGSGAQNEGTAPLYGAAGGIAPTAWSIQSSSAAAAFLIPELNAPSFSQVMLFTSPNGPTFGPASVGDGGNSDQQILTTPVPEPASLAFLVLGLGALIRRSR